MWSSGRHFTLAYLALYRQGIVSEVQTDILLSQTRLCIDRELWVKFRQTFYSRSLGFVSTGNREWSSDRHFTLAYLALYRQGIVSEVQADILLSLTWICIDRELWVKFRKTFYSRILGFVSTRNCEWSSVRHFSLPYLALYQQGIVSEVQTDILLSLTWLVSTRNCEWSSDRHFTRAYMALYRQWIVSEVQIDILLSLTWLCIDRELWVKFRQTFNSRLHGFVSTWNCEWSSERHLTFAYLVLCRQEIVSEVQADILPLLTRLSIDRKSWVKFRQAFYSRLLGFVSTWKCEWSSDRHFTVAHLALYRQGIVSEVKTDIFSRSLDFVSTGNCEWSSGRYLLSQGFVSTGNCEWSSDNHSTIVNTALYQQGVVSEVQRDILLPLTWLLSTGHCERSSLGFLSTEHCEWSSNRHFTLAHLAMHRLGIVSEARSEMFISLTWLWFDGELRVKNRQTFYSHSLGFVSTRSCKWSSDIHFTFAHLALYRQGIVSEAQAHILLSLTLLYIDRELQVKLRRPSTLAHLALYRQVFVIKAQTDILLSLTWLCIDRELWVKLRQTFYSRLLGFVSTGICEWSSNRHFTLAYLALYRQGIVSEAQSDILLSLAWLCIDRELWVKLRQTFYSR